jgi:hypothetical protein
MRFLINLLALVEAEVEEEATEKAVVENGTIITVIDGHLHLGRLLRTTAGADRDAITGQGLVPDPTLPVSILRFAYLLNRRHFRAEAVTCVTFNENPVTSQLITFHSLFLLISADQDTVRLKD